MGDEQPVDELGFAPSELEAHRTSQVVYDHHEAGEIQANHESL